MPGTRPFKQVDVFTRVPFKGNPLAVVLEADGLSDAQMHAIARWTNLSETAFALAPVAPEADYRVRIFSPGTEFPFAGHPTLGTAHALLEAGLVPKTPGRLVQECGVGLVQLAIDGEGALAFRSPEAELRALHDSMRPTLARMLQSEAFGEATIATMGISWLVVRMDSAEACLAVQPDAQALRDLMQVGVTGVAMYGAHPEGGPADYEVRAIFTKMGDITEDPVTGSANACIARVLQAQGFPDGPRSAQGYSARQGTKLACDGRIRVHYADGAPWIGGDSVTVIDGVIHPQ
ncbi:PhzF family phenazine biosynthesis protein [Massilia sp. PAMC28688]|uniref:PhzF family phenazine biosynthesis protein n=1 Tax=Massilia sp. PAMC28688 TaxID=2861283 RepID=UPI001C62AA5D|nr:PhzF family phenazine biosynthesis protein [Massilia sp. PAMC28688]QYF93232.1 PhzF family phenazine biosynthesis protein [Massilia sp. PAMC28688]